MRSRALFLGAEDLDGALGYLRGRAQPAHMLNALTVLEEAESRFPSRTTQLRLRLARARLLHNLARPRDAVELLDRTETPTVDLEHRWLTVRGPALAFMGRFDDAEAAIARGLSLPDANLVANAISWIPTTVAMNALGRSQLPSLETMMRGAVDRARALRHPAMQRSAATVLGWTLLQQGRITEAIELLIVGTDDNAELDYQGMLLLAFGGLATAYAMAGDTAAAQATLDQADREVRTPIRICDPAIAVGHAFTARAQGLPGYASETLRAALLRCHDAGQHLFELFLALTACQIGAPILAVEHTPGLIANVDGPLPEVAHELATATLCRDGARLEAVSATIERLDLLLLAAETAGVAADAHDNAGATRQAIACRVRARQLLDRCPGADDSFLRRSGGPPPLTARELETARHAAMGLSSAEIARRLVVSTRTVDCHLGRVYVKLGVRGRAGLKDHPLLSQPSEVRS
jgi:DNA-binding CsgD family transcriptional regulator